jgi:acyl-CoA reductase-like NAD-dependent aldehyde dehydrogenase
VSSAGVGHEVWYELYFFLDRQSRSILVTGRQRVCTLNQFLDRQSNLPARTMAHQDDTAAIAELEEVFALQRAAFLKNQYPSIEERKANVGKIPGMLIANRDAIREALNKDFGNHPQSTSDLVECLGVAGRAAYVLSQLDKWLATEYRDVDGQMYGESKAEVRYQPKGVVGNIVRKFQSTKR